MSSLSDRLANARKRDQEVSGARQGSAEEPSEAIRQPGAPAAASGDQAFDPLFSPIDGAPAKPTTAAQPPPATASNAPAPQAAPATTPQTTPPQPTSAATPERT